MNFDDGEELEIDKILYKKKRKIKNKFYLQYNIIVKKTREIYWVNEVKLF